MYSPTEQDNRNPTPTEPCRLGHGNILYQSTGLLCVCVFISVCVHVLRGNDNVSQLLDPLSSLGHPISDLTFHMHCLRTPTLKISLTHAAQLRRVTKNELKMSPRLAQ